MLFNLVTNAIKFVPRNQGIIKISSSLTEKQLENYLEISVHDNGPGIALEDQSKLFKPFSKLEAHKKLNPNGNGLGLSICKLICNGLDGDIIVDSRCEKWTQFTFWVKVKIAENYDCDLDPESARVTDDIGIQMQNMQVVRTKEKKTNKANVKQLLQTSCINGGL